MKDKLGELSTFSDTADITQRGSKQEHIHSCRVNKVFSCKYMEVETYEHRRQISAKCMQMYAQIYANLSSKPKPLKTNIHVCVCIYSPS